MNFDQIREKFPTLGLAIYAIEPGGNVMLEIYGAGGDVFQFPAPTQQAALDLAFPPEPVVEPPPGNAFD